MVAELLQPPRPRRVMTPAHIAAAFAVAGAGVVAKAATAAAGSESLTAVYIVAGGGVLTALITMLGSILRDKIRDDRAARKPVVDHQAEFAAEQTAMAAEHLVIEHLLAEVDRLEAALAKARARRRA